MRTRHPITATGFTLVELLVVMAILGVLLGLLLPQFGPIKDKAKRMQCASSLRELALAFGQFAKDNDVYPDRDKWLQRTASEGIVSGQLYRYLGEKKVYVCPSDTDLQGAGAAGGRVTSYSYNTWFDNRNANQQPDMSEAVLFVEMFTGKAAAFTPSFDPDKPVSLTDRHGGGGMVAFGDAHVVYMTQKTFAKDLQRLLRETPTSHRR